MAAAQQKPRKLAAPKHKTFKLSKKTKAAVKPLPKARHLLMGSMRHLWKYKKVFGGITLIYLALTVLMVKGFTVANDVPEIKQQLQYFFEGSSGQFVVGVTIFGLLVGTAANATSEVAGAYQSMLLILVSLSLIWALRQTHAGAKIKIRDAFYRGMYPLVPFVLVLLVIGIQLLPLAASTWLLSLTLAGGLAINALEVVFWSVFCFLLALLSFYMVASSIFALYIVTLPDMTPLKALRSARDLVLNRRWTVLRKLIFLPFSLLVLGAVIIVPIILFATPLTEAVFFVLSMLTLAITHSYVYALYRELL